MSLLWIQCSVYRAHLFIAVTEKYSEKAELHSPRAIRFIMTQLSPQAVLWNYTLCSLSWSGNYNCYDKLSPKLQIGQHKHRQREVMEKPLVPNLFRMPRYSLLRTVPAHMQHQFYIPQICGFPLLCGSTSIRQDKLLQCNATSK